eukprot:31532-Pelagococcus_subviridis.AAC.13
MVLTFYNSSSRSRHRGRLFDRGVQPQVLLHGPFQLAAIRASHHVKQLLASVKPKFRRALNLEHVPAQVRRPRARVAENFQEQL